jgi:hypothetical protein
MVYFHRLMSCSFRRRWWLFDLQVHVPQMIHSTYVHYYSTSIDSI